MMKRKAPTANIDGSCSLDVSESDLSSCDGHLSRFFQQWEHANNENSADVTSLDVSRCRLGPAGTVQLLAFLSRTSSPSLMLEEIHLQRNAIGSEGGRAIGKFLSFVNQNIKLIDLSLNDIKAGGGEPTASKVISDSLTSNDKLSVLVMNKCALGPDGAKDFAAALAFNKSLTRLELDGNMIGPIGGDEIFLSLKTNSALRELGLKMNRIGGCSEKFDVKTLVDSLSAGICCLVKLDLSYNDLRCEGCIILAQAFASKHCTLAELNLEKNDIGVLGSVELASALRTNDTLRKLDLKGNKVCDGGAIAIGDMLSCNNVLKSMDLSSCSIGNGGGSAIGRGLGQNLSLEHLDIGKNSIGEGVDLAFFSEGLSINKTLTKIYLNSNRFSEENNVLWDSSIADALMNNSVLRYIDLSNNALSDHSIIDAVVKPLCSIEYFDVSDNNFESISIETQLQLSKRMPFLNINLSFNPLSSPPLGRLATHNNLQRYLTLLANEKTEVTRIRLMVLGYGGVGKSTFCRAHTSNLDEESRRRFQTSLVPVTDWNTEKLSDWAKQLGTIWSLDASKLIFDQKILGNELSKLIDTNELDGYIQPSQALLEMCSVKYPMIDCATFAKAIYALIQKGYLSTVGVVKVDGAIALGKRTCHMVDFAGQVEFLVSHQLLLASMHTLCMIVQPLPSFGKPDHIHFGSWDYWSRFLSSLGDRRRGSLLLAISQLDKVPMADQENLIDLARRDFGYIKGKSFKSITSSEPVMLDYNPDNILETVTAVKASLTKSLDEVAHSWWVPESYETLAAILQDVIKQKEASNDLPTLTTTELLDEIAKFCIKSRDKSMLLSKMVTDSTLLQRAINYLEAVGDIMQVGEWLLLDPIGWFSSFVAHFIKDELAVSTVQVDTAALRRRRGIVSLEDIVNALGHDYNSPRTYVSQIMNLLTRLDLCVRLIDEDQYEAYLFPCLLPSYCKSSPEIPLDNRLYSSYAVRGHRFREVSGFLPPGLFVGMLARMYKKFEPGVMHSSKMFKDYALLIFNRNATCVFLKLSNDATIDVVAFASDNERLFVGVAKGQASVVIWIVHLIKIFLRSYTQLKFHESWLCPNPECHNCGHDSMGYKGSEFPLVSNSHARHIPHDCDVEGCWRFLGRGHSLEKMKLQSDFIDVCKTCSLEPVFMLRDKVESHTSTK